MLSRSQPRRPRGRGLSSCRRAFARAEDGLKPLKAGSFLGMNIIDEASMVYVMVYV